jgi:hypothetical protein
VIDHGGHVRLVEARSQVSLGGSNTDRIADTLAKRTYMMQK